MLQVTRLNINHELHQGRVWSSRDRTICYRLRTRFGVNFVLASLAPGADIFFMRKTHNLYQPVSSSARKKNDSATETKLSTMYPAFSDRLVVTLMQPFGDCCQWHSCQASMSARRFQHLVLIFVLVAWGGVQ